MLTQRNLTPRPAYSCFNASSASSSHSQGLHHVAPNETSTTSPRIAATSYVFPSTPLSLMLTSPSAPARGSTNGHATPHKVSSSRPGRKNLWFNFHMLSAFSKLNH